MLPNDKVFQPPQFPSGFPLAGVTTGEIDPAVMNQVRAIAHSALDGVLQWAFNNVAPLLLQGLKQGPQAVNAAASGATQAGNLAVNEAGVADGLARDGAGQAANPRVGPYPHGDVDLRFMGANVAPNVQPMRGSRNRNFYFLNQGGAPAQLPRGAADDVRQGGPVTEAANVEIVGFKPG
jgi:hypothetical protein